jgi:DNA ligase (NAD+)
LWVEQIELFYTLWYIYDLVSIYELKSRKLELLTLAWYKEKSINNLLESIENAKNIEITHFLVALNIYGVGKSGAKELSKIITSNEDLLYFPYNIETLESINDIWELTARNIFSYFHTEEHISLIKRLLNYITINYKKTVFEWKYNGKKMCITGSFEWYSREELIQILEKQWGCFVSSVSGKTDFLLAGEKAGSKLKKAIDLWVKIINLEEFYNSHS